MYNNRDKQDPNTKNASNWPNITPTSTLFVPSNAVEEDIPNPTIPRVHTYPVTSSTKESKTPSTKEKSLKKEFNGEEKNPSRN